VLGQPADGVLPAALAPLWALAGGDEQTLDFDWNGGRWRARSRIFGAPAPRGHLLVFNELA